MSSEAGVEGFLEALLRVCCEQRLPVVTRHKFLASVPKAVIPWGFSWFGDMLVFTSSLGDSDASDYPTTS